MAINIDFELCLGCGCCIDVCSSGALELNSKVIINEDDCTECENCVEMCPVGAISK